MQLKIYPSPINGKIKAPASKSVVQRVLAASLMCEGKSLLYNYSPCDDAIAALGIISRLGASVNVCGHTIEVVGTLKKQEEEIIMHCGESGLSSRLFAPLSLLYGNNVVVTGEGSLLKRPFTTMQQPFEDLGIIFSSNNGFLPLQLNGEIKSGNVKVDGSGGSQFLSGLLMTLPLLQGDSVIEVDNLQSKPYIDLTIQILKDYGVTVTHDNYIRFFIKGNQRYSAVNYSIEGDWSGASCLLVAGAVAGSVKIKNLTKDSLQADKAIVEVLKSVGATVTQDNDCIQVVKNRLSAFEFDAGHCPDLFPALAVLAANCSGISRISGVTRLVNKESNRALTLQSELNRLGISVQINGNNMLIQGGRINGGDVFSHNDHRIAMAMAVAGLTAINVVTINGAECVNKSYPAFFEELKSLQNNR